MSGNVTLTGHFTLLDGTPAVGNALIRPSRSPLLDLDGNTVIAGPQRFKLDAEGRFSADLPPTDDPALGDAFTYHVTVSMLHTNWQVTGLTLPSDMVSVDVLAPPAGVVKEYPTRAEWDALTDVAVAEMESALAGAETARDVSVEARDETLTARDETLTARDTAVGAAGEAETARTETFTARDTTVEARDETFTARSETTTALSGAEAARDTAVGAASDAESARDVAVGAAGEAEEALTAALAGKVTGTGMTLRHDTSVGERVFLDHPGGSTMLYGRTGWRDMSSYFPPGVNGTFLARRTTHATDVKIDVTLAADSELIGAPRNPVIDLIPNLPISMFPYDSNNIAPLIMREESSGAPTGTVMLSYRSRTETRMRVTSSSGGAWAVGTRIRISGAVPNDQPWPTTQPGVPGTP